MRLSDLDEGNILVASRNHDMNQPALEQTLHNFTPTRANLINRHLFRVKVRRHLSVFPALTNQILQHRRI